MIQIILRNELVRCKCHGMSGSCQLKTCWKSVPDFRVVGKLLKLQYKRAIMVAQSNTGNGPSMVIVNMSQKSKNNGQRNYKNILVMTRNRRLDTSLLYYQKSPSFCERNQSFDTPGTYITFFVNILQFHCYWIFIKARLADSVTKPVMEVIVAFLCVVGVDTT